MSTTASAQQAQKALFLESKGGAFAVRTTEIPKPGAGELVVKVEAAALNPIDVAIQAFGVFVNKYPAIIGCDGAGTVVAVGADASSFTVGDRIAFQGTINPAEQSINGTFAQYAATPAKFAIKLPASVSFDAGATMPCTLPTAAFVLYNQEANAPSLKLDAPWIEGGRAKYANKSALVLGGSGSVGQYVIQLARLSGFSPIVATASPSNAEFLKALGATHVVDRNKSDEALKEEISKILPGGAALAYDAVSTPKTMPVGYDLTSVEGDFIVVSPPGALGGDKDAPKKRVHMARGLLGLPGNESIAASLVGALPGLLEKGDIQPNRTEILPGGLQAISEGLERHKTKQVSGIKLVVHPQETA